jgi:hypothetical protein
MAVKRACRRRSRARRTARSARFRSVTSMFVPTNSTTSPDELYHPRRILRVKEIAHLL